MNQITDQLICYSGIYFVGYMMRKESLENLTLKVHKDGKTDRGNCRIIYLTRLCKWLAKQGSWEIEKNKTKFTKNYNGQDVVESRGCSYPRATQHIRRYWYVMTSNISFWCLVYLRVIHKVTTLSKTFLLAIYANYWTDPSSIERELELWKGVLIKTRLSGQQYTSTAMA